MAVDYSVRIAALTDAIASGARSVSYEGKSVSYGSLEEMMKALAFLQQLQDQANGVRRPVAGFAGFSRGRRRC